MRLELVASLARTRDERLELGGIVRALVGGVRGDHVTGRGGGSRGAARSARAAVANRAALGVRAALTVRAAHGVRAALTVRAAHGVRASPGRGWRRGAARRSGRCAARKPRRERAEIRGRERVALGHFRRAPLAVDANPSEFAELDVLTDQRLRGPDDPVTLEVGSRQERHRSAAERLGTVAALAPALDERVDVARQRAASACLRTCAGAVAHVLSDAEALLRAGAAGSASRGLGTTLRECAGIAKDRLLPGCLVCFRAAASDQKDQQSDTEASREVQHGVSRSRLPPHQILSHRVRISARSICGQKEGRLGPHG